MSSAQNRDQTRRKLQAAPLFRINPSLLLSNLQQATGPVITHLTLGTVKISNTFSTLFQANGSRSMTPAQVDAPADGKCETRRVRRAQTCRVGSGVASFCPSSSGLQLRCHAALHGSLDGWGMNANSVSQSTWILNMTTRRPWRTRSSMKVRHGPVSRLVRHNELELTKRRRVQDMEEEQSLPL